ncbi:uncharacterized protein DS421_18g603870 [Arachis hypogaea]|nr:uncharacterized protein DS421_18g603870 [Arachis hypogaea]
MTTTPGSHFKSSTETKADKILEDPKQNKDKNKSKQGQVLPVSLEAPAGFPATVPPFLATRGMATSLLLRAPLPGNPTVAAAVQQLSDGVSIGKDGSDDDETDRVPLPRGSSSFSATMMAAPQNANGSDTPPASFNSQTPSFSRVDVDGDLAAAELWQRGVEAAAPSTVLSFFFFFCVGVFVYGVSFEKKGAVVDEEEWKLFSNLGLGLGRRNKDSNPQPLRGVWGVYAI